MKNALFSRLNSGFFLSVFGLCFSTKLDKNWVFWIFSEFFAKNIQFFVKIWWVLTFCHWVFDFQPKNEDSAQKLHKNECFLLMQLLLHRKNLRKSQFLTVFGVSFAKNSEFFEICEFFFQWVFWQTLKKKSLYYPFLKAQLKSL